MILQQPGTPAEERRRAPAAVAKKRSPTARSASRRAAALKYRRPGPGSRAGGPVAHRPFAAVEPGHLRQSVRHHPRPHGLYTRGRGRGYLPGHFSFNVPGGRCDVCQGDGTVTVEMQFLADVELVCEECNGTRLQERHSRHPLPGSEHSRGSAADRPRGHRVLLRHAAPGESAEGARRGRTGLPAPGAERHHAQRRRSPARETCGAPDAAVERRRALPLRRTHHRAALRRHRQTVWTPSAGCSTTAPACWSSSTTWKSSAPRTG